MRLDYGHVEDGQTDSILSLGWTKEVFPFLRPYAWGLAGALVLMFLATAVELTIPYITKKAIDRHIAAVGREIVLPFPMDQELSRLFETIRPSLVPLDQEGRYLIKSADLEQLPSQDISRLKNLGVLRDQRYYLGTVPPALAQVLARQYAGLIETADDLVLIRQEDLASLSRQDLLTLRSPDLVGLSRLMFLLMGLLVLLLVGQFAQEIILEYVSQKTMLGLRMALFSHVQRLPIAFFDSQPIGRLVTRLTNDVQNLDQMFSSVMVTIFKDIFLLAGILLILFRLDNVLGAICLASLPVFAVSTFYFNRKTREAFRLVRQKIGAINGMLQESLSGMKIIQIFRQEAQNYKKFARLNEEHYEASRLQILWTAIFLPLVEWLSYVIIAIILWHGGLGVLDNRLTLGTLVAFLAYIKMFFRPLREISERFNLLQSGLASLERVFVLLHLEGEPQATFSEVAPPPGPGEIVFDNVSFGYTTDRPVIKELSFVIRPGEKMAIVGPTGAGKTSLIHLLARFYEVNSGRILLDGRDIRDIPRQSLHACLGLVAQEGFIFAGSIRDNILLGKDMEEEKFQEILRAVHLDGLIRTLPNGPDTVLHHGGSDFSAGQRQLIAFARVIAHDARVLILDEATANIDPKTERQVQSALSRTLENRTAIIIAHRLATINNVDRILVLQDGRLVESGTHAELMEHDGLYRQLYLLQQGT